MTDLIRMTPGYVWARAGVMSPRDRATSPPSPWNVDRDAHGRIEVCELGCVRLAKIRVNPLCVEQASDATCGDAQDHYRVLLQIAGRSLLRQAGREAMLCAGDWALYRGALPFSLFNLERCEQRLVIVPRVELWGRSRDIEALTVQRFGMQARACEHLASVIDHAFSSVAAFGEEAAAEMAGVAIHLSRLAVIEQGNDRRVRRTGADVLRDRVRAYVARNLRDPGLSVESIAAALNCSTRYLHKVFAEEEQTIAQYILHLRLEKCRSELSCAGAPRSSIAELAYSWGFRSLSYFGKAFRTRYGLTPGEQRSSVSAQPE